MEKGIERYWDSHCNSVTRCVLDFSEITDLEWDHVYFFRDDATFEEVLETLDVEQFTYAEFSRKVILMKDGNIVYSEQTESNVESAVQGQLWVGSLFSDSRYRKYSRENTTFVLRRVAVHDDVEAGYFFQLLEPSEPD